MAWISPVRGKHIFKHAIGGHKPAKIFVNKSTKLKCEWKCVFPGIRDLLSSSCIKQLEIQFSCYLIILIT